MFVLFICVIYLFIYFYYRFWLGFEVTIIYFDGYKKFGGDFEGLVRIFVRFGGVDLVKCA